MENTLQEQLDCSTVKSLGAAAGGCISSADIYLADGMKIFVKKNAKTGSRGLVTMFDGEFASVSAIIGTQTVKAPKPLKVFDHNDTCYFAMEYLELNSLNQEAANLGRALAKMHLHNKEMIDTAAKQSGYIGQCSKGVHSFGFEMTTCCGSIGMPNDWHESWLEFFARNRLQAQLNLIENTYQEREALSLWSQIQRNLSKLIPNELKIVPSLLHGDLWSGNTGETDGQPCIFDPASLYGHHEFDLSIAHMFGGFPTQFFDSYHQIIPMDKGFKSRLKLYQLFHYLNHWNHFGSGYRASSISIMKTLAQ
uniref:protein-ribulosamine 3-kinase n=1 Tax=Ciona savignyi TaxID=51511 RepID=H2ZLX1_CIOSA